MRYAPPIPALQPYEELFKLNAEYPPKGKFYTMPTHVPEYTLGWSAIAWMADNLTQPNGKLAGQPFKPTASQVWFALHFYSLDPENLRFHYAGACLRRSKGYGKSPWAAALSLLELLGPVVPLRIDDRVPGKVVGVPRSMPVISVLATAQSQTENTLRMVRGFSNKNTALAKKYGLEAGKTYVETQNGGKLKSLASSVGSAEGEETSFAVLDETEHWLPAQNGPELAATVRRNLSKTGARYVETSNAWQPGQGSVAEDSYNDWVDAMTEHGRSNILYDAISAPPNSYMVDELPDDAPEGSMGVTDVLKFLYADSPWVSIESIKQDISRTSTAAHEASRFYFNHPMVADDAWISRDEWMPRANKARVIQSDEPIVMFFDGSKSNDHTALVGMTLDETPHIFKLGHWRPDPATNVIDVGKVDYGILKALENYNVVGFWGDVREWESFVYSSWPEKAMAGIRKELWANPSGRVPAPVAWDMRTHTNEFAAAVEALKTAVLEGNMTHDGDAALMDHVTNAKAYEIRGRVSIRKESPKSSRKIDLAVCAAGCMALYIRATAPRETKVDNTPFRVFL